MKKTIKSGVIVVSLVVFLQGNTLFAETNGQAANRAKNLVNEVEYLAKMGDYLTGEAWTRWNNYMAGFALGAYEMCEYLNNLGLWDFSSEMSLYLELYQIGRKLGATTNSYYYILGGQRAKEGKGRRIVIDDFR